MITQGEQGNEFFVIRSGEASVNIKARRLPRPCTLLKGWVDCAVETWRLPFFADNAGLSSFRTVDAEQGRGRADAASMFAGSSLLPC